MIATKINAATRKKKMVLVKQLVPIESYDSINETLVLLDFIASSHRGVAINTTQGWGKKFKLHEGSINNLTQN